MNPYKILDRHDLKEYQAEATLYQHQPSGAEIYHISCEDKENSFAFSFRTPPNDSSGLPHILEHTVLCGSQSFPIKDPFITLYKGSMHTFLNAYTAPDRTVYPASSVVEKDYFNLMRIYGDAVFFPLLRKEAFMQEGHHMELDENNEPQCVGIVYNEMKGSYSSHESLLSEYSFRELFPGTPLSYDSGGDPAAIPDLTYRQFCDFHETYYHPSNCRIFIYGDIPAEKTLEFLDKHFLSRFNARSLDSSIASPETWKEPKEMVFAAPKGDEEGCSHCINWRLPPNWDAESRIALQVLSQILVGTAGAPIQMAVQQSHLGEDLSPVSGLELDVKDMIYTIGIRGSKKDQARQFRDMIFSELKKLTDHGIPEDQIEGALRLVEFREREIRGGLPFGLKLLGRCLRTWNYDRSPREGLEFERHLTALRARAFDKGFWEELIHRFFLENPHYTLITLYPDDQYEPAQEELEARRNRQWLDSLGSEERSQWEKDLQSLRRFQEEEDDTEILESIPFLSRHEIPDEVVKIPVEITTEKGIRYYRQPLFTNGVFYVNLGFSINDFSPEERLWLPFFSHSLTEIGAAGLSYDQMAHKMSLNLGGLSSFLVSSSTVEEDQPLCHMVLQIKMLEQQIPQAIELTEQIMFERDFQQPRRIKELLVEMRNDIRTSLIPNGSGYALTRAASVMSGASMMDEIWYGVTQYQHMQDAVERWDNKGQQQIIDFLEQLSQKLFSRIDWVSFTAAEDQLPGFEEQWNRQILNWERNEVKSLNTAIEDQFSQQSWEAPTTVSYSAAVMKGPAVNSQSYSAQLVISHLLKSGYLWETVRMKGGAYGASAGVSGLEKYFFFTAYRDPRGSATFKEFRESLVSLKEHITEKDIDLALIGLVGKDLKPLSPSQKGSLAVKRDLYGLSDSLRQENRNRLLQMTPAIIREELDSMLEQWDKEHRLVLLSSKEQIDKSSAQYPELAEHRQKLGL